VVLGVAGLAALAPYPQARHGRPLAAERIRSLLDVQVAPGTGKPGGGRLASGPDSTDESSEQVVGSPRVHGELLKLGIKVAPKVLACTESLLPRSIDRNLDFSNS
jgi:hypothetical protein